LTKRAVDVLGTVDVVAGYRTYIDLIRPLIEGKFIISTGMTQEVERVAAAIEQARSAKSCAIVSSGDPGIYAMAGLVFETCKLKNIPIAPPLSDIDCRTAESTLVVEVVPGIPALSAGASLLGAPLTHDFAAISLSDLLTPWEVIEQRLEAAARADFVAVLYNPKSKRRTWQLARAQQIFLKFRASRTPVGIVVSAMRQHQQVRIVALKDLHQEYVDMQTTVFIGSSATGRYLDYMVTPRGYAKKYDFGNNK
jgi:precorrin-3B C17-methyltransferase